MQLGLGGLLNAAFVGLVVDGELIVVALLLLGGVQLRMCCRQFGQVGIAAVGGEVEAFVGAYHAPAVGA